MNHTLLKKFATKARKDLMEQVGARLSYVLGSDSVALREHGAQVKELRAALQKESQEALVERVAYTWFNRLAALRFMDVDGRHPFGCRVVTALPGNTQPEILLQARNGNIPKGLKLDVPRLNDLLDGRVPSSNSQAEVYRLLVVAVCNFYHKLMPFVFEKIEDYTELLLPEDLLSEASVAAGFRTAIADEDCAEVELIGWLYQYYIAEKKDAVMARKKAVPKEDIPAVTQLFTPHWIVRYMVENSLGRLWMQSRPSSRLKEMMDYYIENPEAATVASGQGLVASGEEGIRGEKFYESKELQGSDRMAKDNAAGEGNLQGHEGISEGRVLRTDKSGSPSGSVGSVEHRRRAREAIDCGVQELPFDSPGLANGSGNPASPRAALRVSGPGSDTQNRVTHHRDRQNAPLPESEAQLTPNPSPLTPDVLTVARPEDIRLIDPACGSGHILTYAFNLLYAIYEEEGYEPNAIPELILTKNLYGVEIDERAAGLAYFALMMKAQQHSKHFLRKQLRTSQNNLTPRPYPLTPNICCLEEIRFEEGELRAYMDALDIGDLFTGPVMTLMHQFEQARNFGSLIQPVLEDVGFLRDAIACKNLGGELFLMGTHRKVETVLRQAEFLSQRYHCAVANPPYMNKFNGPLKNFVVDHFKDYKSDLFAAFIIRSKKLTVETGFLAFMTPFVWMFISSYEKLRINILEEATLTSLIQLEYSGFDGATVPICTFTVLNKHLPNYRGGFVRLSDFRGAKLQGPKAMEIIQAARKAGK